MGLVDLYSRIVGFYFSASFSLLGVDWSWQERGVGSAKMLRAGRLAWPFLTSSKAKLPIQWNIQIFLPILWLVYVVFHKPTSSRQFNEFKRVCFLAGSRLENRQWNMSELANDQDCEARGVAAPVGFTCINPCDCIWKCETDALHTYTHTYLYIIYTYIHTYNIH